MRQLLFTVACTFIFTTVLAQPPKWYLSVSTGPGWGGPKGSIKSKFEKTGFNQTSTFSFFGLGGSTKYPIVSSGVPLLLKVGKKLKGKRSVYVIGGVSASAEVSGFKDEGSNNGLFSLWGTSIFIRYNIILLAAGMEYTMPKSRIKLGYAPGAFLLRYGNNRPTNKGNKTISVVPGLALTARLPMGKETSSVGVELVADINLAPLATIKEQYKTFFDSSYNNIEKEVLSPTKVNMVHGMAGLALTFRKKQNVSKSF